MNAEIQNTAQSFVNESLHDVPLEALAARIEALYRHIGEGESEVCIVLMDDEDIRELNKEWRDIDEPTDVLSFPMREGESQEIAIQLPLGDIVISVETAHRYVESQTHKERLEENASARLKTNWTLLDELTFLCIHGTLHLLGFDHAEPDEEADMRAKELEWMQYVLSQEANAKA